MQGFMWIGTRDGLNRFDGNTIDILQYDLKDSSSISNNSITALATVSNGDVWAGTNFGLNRVDSETLKAKSYYHWFEDSTAISSNKISALCEDQLGRLWIGTDNGLNRLDDWEENSFVKFSIDPNDPTSLSNNAINDVLVDSAGRVWVATQGGLNLYLPETNSFRRYRLLYEDDNSLSNNQVLSLCEDLDGNLWIGTKNGLNKYNFEMDVFTRYYIDTPKKDLLPSNIINDLIIDESGDLWVGTPSGLSRISKEMKKSTQYHTAPGKSNSLPNDHILSLYSGISGMVWIGTKSAGVAMLDLEAPQFVSVVYTGQNGYLPEENQIYSFYEADTNHIYIGTGKGLAVYNSRNDTSFFFSNSETHKLREIDTPVLSITSTSDGLLWIGTDGVGLVSFSREADSIAYYNTNSLKTGSLFNNTITDIKKDAQENLWIATAGGGLSYFNRKSNSFKTFRFDGNDPNSIRDNNVSSIVVDSLQNVWFGTGNAGLYHLNSETEQLTRYQAGNVNDGFLPSNTINQVFIDTKNHLWVSSSSGGISKYDPLYDSFRTYNSNQGLANNVALALTSDSDGNLWVSTNGGVSTFNTETETFRNYNEQDVLGQNTFYPRSILSTSRGLIMFGGANGFDYIDYHRIQENDLIPRVVITGFQLINFKENLNSPKSFIAVSDQMELEYNHSGFTIEFAALNFKQAHKNQYAYRLIGLFDQWRYIGTRHFATFSNLNPGTYTFEVIGSNNDGYWNNEPAVMKIIVQPAYWQTKWFQILIAVAIVSLLYLFYRFKLSSEKERNQRLEQAVNSRTSEISKERDTNAILLKEVHHRVKNNLQIIVSLLNLQSRFITDSKLLDVFSEIQNRVRSMSLIHEKMYKTKDLKTVNIEEYITDLSNSLLNTYRLAQKVELDVLVEVNKFNSDTLTPLGLIINEVISNALKYAFKEDKAGKIFVRITKLENGRYSLIIGDDGIGMPNAILIGETESFGTELIEALSEQLNGSIKLLSNRKGTVYEVEFEDVGD